MLTLPTACLGCIAETQDDKLKTPQDGKHGSMSVHLYARRHTCYQYVRNPQYVTPENAQVHTGRRIHKHEASVYERYC